MLPDCNILLVVFCELFLYQSDNQVYTVTVSSFILDIPELAIKLVSLQVLDMSVLLVQKTEAVKNSANLPLSIKKVKQHRNVTL